MMENMFVAFRFACLWVRGLFTPFINDEKIQINLSKKI